MSVMPIYNCFHPVMRRPTEQVTEFDGTLKQLVDDMFETMYNIPYGVGLAGNQVGKSLSVVVIDTSIGTDNPGTKPLTLINPVIEDFSDYEADENEGCLSIPEFYEKVSRSEAVQVRFNDVDGGEHVMEAEDFLARVIQHEADHLQGKIIVDRISPLKRTLNKSKLKKIERGKVEAKYVMIQPDGSVYTPGKK